MVKTLKEEIKFLNTFVLLFNSKVLAPVKSMLTSLSSFSWVRVRGSRWRWRTWSVGFKTSLVTTSGPTSSLQWASKSQHWSYILYLKIRSEHLKGYSRELFRKIFCKNIFWLNLHLGPRATEAAETQVKAKCRMPSQLGFWWRRHRGSYPNRKRVDWSVEQKVFRSLYGGLYWSFQTKGVPTNARPIYLGVFVLKRLI